MIRALPMVHKATSRTQAPAQDESASVRLAALRRNETGSVPSRLAHAPVSLVRRCCLAWLQMQNAAASNSRRSGCVLAGRGHSQRKSLHKQFFWIFRRVTEGLEDPGQRPTAHPAGPNRGRSSTVPAICVSSDDSSLLAQRERRRSLPSSGKQDCVRRTKTRSAILQSARVKAARIRETWRSRDPANSADRSLGKRT
jgi:hypothetical protein